MKRETQLRFQQLGVIALVWLIVGCSIAVYDHLVLIGRYSLGRSPEYSFGVSLAINVGVALFGALIGGSALVFYVNVKYQDKPYGQTILAVYLIFVLIVLLLALLIGIIMGPMLHGTPLPESMRRMAPRSFKNLLVWSIVVAITQLMLQVNNKFGQAAFFDIIRGKYHTPRSETRIFMFLDLNSSTMMADRLGDEAYHSLLRDFFADITGPIVANQGEIYQYVGDEVVIAWKYQGGREQQHCLDCFFEMKRSIQLLQEKYLTRYGLVPAFKAGMHCGRVIAGEVGIIKRDITYSGNVLNTTSRILGKCSELREELIVSEDLLSQLNWAEQYAALPLGAIKLRGREKEIMLNAVRMRA